MKLIEVIAASEGVFDIKKNTLTYATEVEAGAGVLLEADKSGDKDMLIVNRVHNGGRVTIIMKPFRTPAKKYNAGEVVAILMVNE